jgi:hypothetical protein
MDPFTLALIMGAASTAINAYAAYQKGEISKQEYQQAVQAANELERKLKTLRPDETWENIDPQLLQKTAEYSPDIAAFVEENAPQLVTEAGSSAEKRIQRQALQKYASMAESGRDVISDAQREQALFEADARAKQRQQALMDRMRQQGLLGSGAGLAAQLQTEQATAQEARQESLRGVQEAEMRRRQALGEAAQLAGQLRQANVNVESANVNTMNAFNQRLANARNLYNQYASGQRNQAQMENQRREIARQAANVQTGNQYALMNRRERLAAQERARQFDVDLAKTMYQQRQGAEGKRFDGLRQEKADYATAVTSGIGTGLSVYGMGMKYPGAQEATSALVGDASDYAGPLSRNMPSYEEATFNPTAGINFPQDTTPSYAGPMRPAGQDLGFVSRYDFDEDYTPGSVGRRVNSSVGSVYNERSRLQPGITGVRRR